MIAREAAGRNQLLIDNSVAANDCDLGKPVTKALFW